MALLVVTLTTAGIAAVVNAQNTGTAPVTISQVGFTATPFTADASTAAIPGEIKRLATLSGDVVADDTIHLTVRDESADAYSLTGFGLYLADGTLFAVYSQADAILEKAAPALALLAIDIKVSEVSAAALTFGDADFINPPGTEQTPGVLQLASDAEIAAGAIGTKPVQPRGLKALLDGRFGVGSASEFVKGLLTAASAAAFRVAIGLGNAATKDAGAGNGLDADLLDGQEGAYYRAWANLTGVPGTFPPSGHNHDAAAINTGTLALARLPIGTSGAAIPRLDATNTWGQQKFATPDGSPTVIYSGATKGARFIPSASGMRLEGTDQTGIGSFQPLILGGSQVQVSLSSGPASDVLTAAGGWSVTSAVTISVPSNNNALLFRDDTAAKSFIAYPLQLPDGSTSWNLYSQVGNTWGGLAFQLRGDTGKLRLPAYGAGVLASDAFGYIDIATFAKSTGATSGYFKVPGGLIVQYLVLLSVSGGQSFNWPLAFPNACLAANVTNRGDAEDCNLALTIDGQTAGGTLTITGTAPGSVYIVGIGY